MLLRLVEAEMFSVFCEARRQLLLTTRLAQNSANPIYISCIGERNLTNFACASHQSTCRSLSNCLGQSIFNIQQQRRLNHDNNCNYL